MTGRGARTARARAAALARQTQRTSKQSETLSLESESQRQTKAQIPQFIGYEVCCMYSTIENVQYACI